MRSLLVAFAMLCACPAWAHDTWVLTAATMPRPDDVVHVDLMLGNHGNDHRDFKLAGKLTSLDGASLNVIAPGGRRTDLVPDMVDLGYAEKEGYWSGRFVCAEEGLHCVAHSLDRIHRDKHTVKSAKTYFLVADTPPAATAPRRPATEPLGHALELVPETHPVLEQGPGQEIAVRLLFRGRPLPDARVSFVPRGATLAEGFDPAYERRTDAEGRCRWTPKEGTFVLVVAHVDAPEESGAGFARTVYSATLVVNVPQRCPCCD